MFIANKPCTFRGQNFLIGEVIPTELIDERAIGRLKQMRVITEVDADAKTTVKTASANTISVPIVGNDGEFTVELQKDTANLLFNVLQHNTEDATVMIEGITDTDLLLCIHALDGRKNIKKLAKERATALNNA